ncbi:MAG: group 1 truncated hemoglobin [Dehalococcoidia bacterium]
MTQVQSIQATGTLYERLGGGERLRQLVGEIVEAHLQNPGIRTRFEAFDPAAMKEGAFQFFAQAMGGPEVYSGRGLVETHRGMNVNEQEFVAATDDVLGVLQKHGVGAQEQMEILAAFFAMKDQVLHL